MELAALFRKEFEAYLSEKITQKEPGNLYEPMRYILSLGGKRVRPVLLLMATHVFDENYKKGLHAALAVEVFHNFSLIHDDIMDDAPLRRGKKTVHELWDLNTGILSGDAMLINAYQLLEHYEGETFREMAQLFTKTAMQVCEGQQYDLDFESRDDVSLQEYLKMIEYKTAVLLGAALKMGGIVGQASQMQQNKLYEYGRLLGIAFQLQDDYLDVFGNPKDFGKQVGGDIIENKKTFLFLSAMAKSSKREARQLEHLYSLEPANPFGKVEAVKNIFEDSGAAQATRAEIEKYTQQAIKTLEEIQIEADKKELLKDFGKNLMQRAI